jgi:putative endonuclease
VKTSPKIVGKIGEDCATSYLLSKKWDILDRNYYKKWGEIDIIALKDHTINFIEVKTITKRYICNTGIDEYRPEDNIHLYKTKRLKRTIQTYLLERQIPLSFDWEFSIITIILNREDLCLLELKYLENIII